MDLQDRRTWQFRGRCMGQLIDNIKGQKQATWGPDDKIIMRHFLAKGRLCAHDVEELPPKDLAKSLNILSVDDEELTAVEWATIIGKIRSSYATPSRTTPPRPTPWNRRDFWSGTTTCAQRQAPLA
ncbi:hypothetical protein K4K48_006562 [Colletotrichum sp. SAR 10_66]|nr:hypothetical protein K4K48_006562 [Colletotrichum sp. SAR 10_66]